MVTTLPIEAILSDPDNANRGTAAGGDKLRDAIAADGAGRSILLDRNGVAMAGNKTLSAARAAGVRNVIVVKTRGDDIVAVQREDVELESAQGRRMALADNGLGAANQDIDAEIVRRQAERWEIDLAETGFDAHTLARFQAAAMDAAGDAPEPDADVTANPDAPAEAPAAGDAAAVAASGASGVPSAPCDVLDGRAGPWAARRGAWAARGLRPIAPFRADFIDPALLEILFKWYAQPLQSVLDLCAGGPDAGMVAHGCGLAYVGIEPKGEQVAANRAAAEDRIDEANALPRPVWMEGYAQSLLRAPDLFGMADLVFCAPPTHDAVKYSTDGRDFSNMPWGQFVTEIGEIVRLSLAILRPSRFTIWLVNDRRDGDGRCRDIPGVVTAAHIRHGAALFQDAVYLAPAANDPAAGVSDRQAFATSRTMARRHTRILIFFNGSTRTIREHFPADIPMGVDADASGERAAVEPRQ